MFLYPHEEYQRALLLLKLILWKICHITCWGMLFYAPKLISSCNMSCCCNVLTVWAARFPPSLVNLLFTMRMVRIAWSFFFSQLPFFINRDIVRLENLVRRFRDAETNFFPGYTAYLDISEDHSLPQHRSLPHYFRATKMPTREY